MLRLYPNERKVPTMAVRNSKPTKVNDLVNEIGLFTAYFDGKPVTELGELGELAGYAGYLICSKPANENEEVFIVNKEF